MTLISFLIFIICFAIIAYVALTVTAWPLSVFSRVTSI